MQSRSTGTITAGSTDLRHVTIADCARYDNLRKNWLMDADLARAGRHNHLLEVSNGRRNESPTHAICFAAESPFVEFISENGGGPGISLKKEG